MASRRKLKKVIHFVTSELITEIYFRLLMSDKMSEEKVEALIIEINRMNREFTLRAGHADGKENPAIIKKYYHQLQDDWQRDVIQVVAKMEKL